MGPMISERWNLKIGDFAKFSFWHKFSGRLLKIELNVYFKNNFWWKKLASREDWVKKGVNYFFLLYGCLREQARWIKLRAVICYPSGQDGDILPVWDYPLYMASKLHLELSNYSLCCLPANLNYLKETGVSRKRRPRKRRPQKRWPRKQRPRKQRPRKRWPRKRRPRKQWPRKRRPWPG